MAEGAAREKRSVEREFQGAANGEPREEQTPGTREATAWRGRSERSEDGCLVTQLSSQPEETGDPNDDCLKSLCLGLRAKKKPNKSKKAESCILTTQKMMNAETEEDGLSAASEVALRVKVDLNEKINFFRAKDIFDDAFLQLLDKAPSDD